jgi:hypothetical protein
LVLREAFSNQPSALSSNPFHRKGRRGRKGKWGKAAHSIQLLFLLLSVFFKNIPRKERQDRKGTLGLE